MSPAEASSPRGVLRELRRPLILAAISITCLVLQHLLLRTMAHRPVAPNAALSVPFVVVRFLSVILVPGLLLGGAAEIVAYVLVGPKRTEEDDAGDEVDV